MYQRPLCDLQFLRYRVWQAEIGNYGSFFALLPFPAKTKKIKILKKWKKLLDISLLYTSVPETTIIWGTFPEIRNETHNFLSFWGIFCHFTPLTTRKIKIKKKKNNEKCIWRCHHFTHVYQKSQSYDVCFLRYGIPVIFPIS